MRRKIFQYIILSLFVMLFGCSGQQSKQGVIERVAEMQQIEADTVLDEISKKSRIDSLTFLLDDKYPNIANPLSLDSMNKCFISNLPIKYNDLYFWQRGDFMNERNYISKDEILPGKFFIKTENYCQVYLNYSSLDSTTQNRYLHSLGGNWSADTTDKIGILIKDLGYLHEWVRIAYKDNLENGRIVQSKIEGQSIKFLKFIESDNKKWSLIRTSFQGKNFNEAIILYNNRFQIQIIRTQNGKDVAINETDIQFLDKIIDWNYLNSLPN